MEARRDGDIEVGEPGDALQTRLSRYGAQVASVVTDFPDTRSARHVEDELIRSGTGCGAHYAEARSAQSRDDFLHKISLAAKEARESLHWLRVAVTAGLVDRDITAILDEGDELVAMLFSSVQTARGNKGSR